jgi:hypothetical protein
MQCGVPDGTAQGAIVTVGGLLFIGAANDHLTAPHQSRRLIDRLLAPGLDPREIPTRVDEFEQYRILDRDARFSAEVNQFLDSAVD